MVNLLELLPWILITGIVPLVMLFLPYMKKKISERDLHLMLGMSAGILLGISIFDIIPEAYKINVSSAGTGIALGFVSLLIIEHILIKGNHVGGHKAGSKHIQPFGTLAMGGMVVHGLIDGFVIPLGFSASTELGIIVGLAVALHQIPASFSRSGRLAYTSWLGLCRRNFYFCSGSRFDSRASAQRAENLCLIFYNRGVSFDFAACKIFAYLIS